MIDMKKQNRNEFSITENSFEERQPKNQDKKTIQAKEKNAKKFLCVMLSVLVVFVSIACLAVNKRNETLRAQQIIDEFENGESKNDTAQADDSAKKPEGTQKEEPVNDTKANETKQDETKQDATENKPANVTAAAPGTLGNPKVITINKDNWEMTLVNSGYRIPDSYEPDLVYVCDSDQRLDRKVAEAYEKMYQAGLKDGVTLTPCSGYRSYERQEKNYNRKIEFYLSQGYTKKDAEAKAATIIMPPGSSEHNLGYAMDIVCVDNWFKDTKEYTWLMKNAQDYGFILRYAEDKQDITKVIYEPWHWRYVGIENAKAIKESGLCMEEYLGVAK